MGIVFEQVAFDGKAPLAVRVAERLEEIVGQPMILTERSAQDTAELYDLDIQLAFARFPEEQIKLKVYRPGAVKESLEKMNLAETPLANIVTGANEPPGMQTVHIRWWPSREPTLFYATILALESLGGRLRKPFPDDLRRAYDCPMSEKEWNRRRRKNVRNRVLGRLGNLILLPFLISLWLLQFSWGLLSMPWRIFKAYRWQRDYMRHHPLPRDRD